MSLPKGYTKEDDFEELIRKGDEYFDKDNYRDSIIYYQKAIRLKPSDATLGFKLVFSLLVLATEDEDTNLLAEANNHADQLKEVFEGVEDENLKLGISLFTGIIFCFVGKYDEALDYLLSIEKNIAGLLPIEKSITEIMASDEIAVVLTYYLFTGLSNYHVGRVNEAIGYYDKAINYYHKNNNGLDPIFVAIFHNRGIAQKDQGKYDDALSSFEKSLELDESARDVLISKCEVLVQLKNYKAAEQCNKVLVRLFEDSSDDNNPITLNNKGVALFNIGLYHDALKYFDKALENKKDYAEAWLNKGTVIYQFGMYKEALKYFDKALENKKDYAEAWLNMGLCSLVLQDYVKSIEYCKKVLEHKDLQQKASLNIGIAYYYYSHYIEALENLKKVKDSDLTQIRDHYMGLCYYELGMYDKTEELFKAILEADSAIPPTTRHNLAIAYAKQGKTKEAKQILKADQRSDYSRQAYLQIEKVELTEQTDWYRWWFRNTESKKLLGGLLIFLIGSFILLIAINALITDNDNSATVGNNTDTDNNPFLSFLTLDLQQSVILLVVIVLLVAVLLLPSLKKIKIGEFEFETLETMPSAAQELELSPILSFPSYPVSEEALEYAKDANLFSTFRKALAV